MKYGIMQGRLLPKYKGRYQAFPINTWEKEFKLASMLNLSSIEFILDYHEFENNPLMSKAGLTRIKQAVSESAVDVKSVCADYFMDNTFHSNEIIQNQQSKLVLSRLIDNCSLIGVTDIVIPCVDQASLNTHEKKDLFCENIQEATKQANELNINIALELDLKPPEVLELLGKIGSKSVTINYDLGNSASQGYDVEEEFSVYGKYITDIHIKDRVFRGGPVVLGKGNVDFKNFFISLKKYNVTPNLFIFQAFRDDEGVDIFKKQYKWYKEAFKKFNKKNGYE
jgi:L-ribulose-5-phosphate 3-epimerase